MSNRNKSLIIVTAKLPLFATCLMLVTLLLTLTSCGPAATPGSASKSVNEDPNIPDDSGLLIHVNGPYYAAPGSSASYTVTLENAFIYPDVYTVTLTPKLGWADLSHAPHSIALDVGASTTFTYRVNVPITATASLAEDVSISVDGKHSSNGIDVSVGVKP